MFDDDELRDYHFIGVAFVVLYVVFVATAGRPYYLAGLYAPLAAAGALRLQRRRETAPSRRRWLIWLGYGLSVASAAAVLILSVSIARPDVGERIAQRAATAYYALPTERGERTVVFGESYIVTAYVDGYSKRYQQPEAYSTNRSYGYFPPPPAGDDTVLYVGRDPGALRTYFADVRTVGDVGDDMRAYLLTGQRQSWDEIWPRVRTLTREELEEVFQKYQRAVIEVGKTWDWSGYADHFTEDAKYVEHAMGNWKAAKTSASGSFRR